MNELIVIYLTIKNAFNLIQNDFGRLENIIKRLRNSFTNKN